MTFHQSFSLRLIDLTDILWRQNGEGRIMLWAWSSTTNIKCALFGLASSWLDLIQFRTKAKNRFRTAGSGTDKKSNLYIDNTVPLEAEWSHLLNACKHWTEQNLPEGFHKKSYDLLTFSISGQVWRVIARQHHALDEFVPWISIAKAKLKNEPWS